MFLKVEVLLTVLTKEGFFFDAAAAYQELPRAFGNFSDTRVKSEVYTNSFRRKPVLRRILMDFGRQVVSRTLSDIERALMKPQPCSYDSLLIV